ncbi:MAG: hypothetical protein V4596_04725 [Bdellovibrionota bacterium]
MKNLVLLFVFGISTSVFASQKSGLLVEGTVYTSSTQGCNLTVSAALEEFAGGPFAVIRWEGEECVNTEMDALTSPYKGYGGLYQHHLTEESSAGEIVSSVVTVVNVLNENQLLVSKTILAPQEDGKTLKEVKSKVEIFNKKN